MIQVYWRKSARKELGDIWTKASAKQQGALESRVLEMLSRLRSSPEEVGESRPGGKRIGFVGRLGFTFRVLPDKSMVHIIHIWTFY